MAGRTAIPDKVLAKLHPSETRLRLREINRLHEAARLCPNPEHSRYLIARAQRVAMAMPICCLLAAKARISASPLEPPDKGAAARELSERNRYPDGLEHQVSQALLNQSATLPEAMEIAEHHRVSHV